jgi:hypothetical protein
MSPDKKCPVLALLTVSLILAGARADVARAQAQGQSQTPPGLPTEITQVRFNSGQSIVPYYEGWIRNQDGTFDLVFGYFNRNFKEELAIPAGANNKVEPGNADQGQPTYFLPRRQRFLFRVRVPANFGKGIVTWTVTANGKTEKAFGDLIAPEEITERVVATNGNFDPGLDDPNTAPKVTLTPVTTATTNAPLSLVVSVTDDGLPKPRAAPRPATPPPAPTPGQPNFAAQVNSSGGGRPTGLRVSWLEYRGPGKVTFEPAGQTQIANGQGTVSARFSAPGDYVLIGSTTDGQISTKVRVNVTVTGGSTAGGQ